MKKKTNIIIGLGISLIVISILFVCGVGKSSRGDLTEEELSAFKNRKEFTSLSNPAEKASYAVGMSQFAYVKYLDGKNDEFLAPYYYVIANPRYYHYYGGQLNIPGAPLNFKTWRPEVDYPLNEESFIAGFAQRMENNALVSGLTGDKGKEYIDRVVLGKQEGEEEAIIAVEEENDTTLIE